MADSTKPDYQNNNLTWQSYVYMKVCMESMRDGIYPNGQKFTAKDYTETQQHIDNCTEVLKHHGVQLPVLDGPAQLKLF